MAPSTEILKNRPGLMLVRRYEWAEPEWLSGEILDMTDGARWFHPNNGGAPTKITPDNAAALRFA